jgi:hypothetical protein
MLGRRRDAPFSGHADDLLGSWAALMCELHQLSVLASGVRYPDRYVFVEVFPERLRR